jgi:hypothetical protein
MSDENNGLQTDELVDDASQDSYKIRLLGEVNGTDPSGNQTAVVALGLFNEKNEQLVREVNGVKVPVVIMSYPITLAKSSKILH